MLNCNKLSYTYHRMTDSKGHEASSTSVLHLSQGDTLYVDPYQFSGETQTIRGTGSAQLYEAADAHEV